MRRTTRKSLLAAGLVAVLAQGCADDAGPITDDPEGHLEPGDEPEGAPDGGFGDEPTETEPEGRLRPGEPET